MGRAFARMECYAAFRPDAQQCCFLHANCPNTPTRNIANMCIVLIKQADYLLYRQLKRLEKDFLDHGGFSEKMAKLRP
ncbi:MAG: four helix bundle suffix domain-containing protein [Bacteroidales bacterium]|nr:four helix bundle suffix domain-containing protein [Bacteroidales bacterium]